MVEPFFTNGHVNELEYYVQDTVNKLLDDMIERDCKEPVDLIKEFALPVPSYVS